MNESISGQEEETFLKKELVDPFPLVGREGFDGRGGEGRVDSFRFRYQNPGNSASVKSSATDEKTKTVRILG